MQCRNICLGSSYSIHVSNVRAFSSLPPTWGMIFQNMKLLYTFSFSITDMCYTSSIPGAEVFNWTHSHGSCLCIGICMDFVSDFTSEIHFFVFLYLVVRVFVDILLPSWTVHIDPKLKCYILLREHKGLLWSFCVILLWEISHCLLR